MQRYAATPSPCAIGGLLELLTRPWTLHILWSLSTNGPMRFGVLRKNVAGISSRVPTQRVRTLENKGFVFRHYQPTIPPAVTYGITGRMKDIEKCWRNWKGGPESGRARERRPAPRPRLRGRTVGRMHTPDACSCEPEQLPPTISLKN